MDTKEKSAKRAKKTKKVKLVKSRFFYWVARVGSTILAKLLFKRKYIRNELKHAKGPAIVLANHQTALDFANLLPAARAKMNFVVSNSFFNTLPIRGAMRSVGVIPKQQFQTSLHDISAMKRVVTNGGILAMYPAGLMCEDGIDTPVPAATWRFVQHFDADIYVARTYGTYFVKPKWAKKTRRGRTYMDIYKVFSKEEVGKTDPALFAKTLSEALEFDAYRDQKELMIKYKDGDCIEGLENVLYMCPACRREFTTVIEDKREIHCIGCGYSAKADVYGMLHKMREHDEDLRHVSDWSRVILDETERQIDEGILTSLYSRAKIQTIDLKKKKYVEVGEGEVTLADAVITLKGTVNGEPVEISSPTTLFASLPFRPGAYFELQHGEISYRLMLEDGRLAQKFINMIKVYYRREQRKKAAALSHGATS